MLIGEQAGTIQMHGQSVISNKFIWHPEFVENYQAQKSSLIHNRA